jgi:hypothetical protein
MKRVSHPLTPSIDNVYGARSMRARAGDPPRTMAQKILAGRCADPMLSGDMVQVKVDQIVLTRSPLRAVAEAREAGLKKTTAEVAIVYDTHCATGTSSKTHVDDMQAASSDILAHGKRAGALVRSRAAVRVRT